MKRPYTDSRDRQCASVAVGTVAGVLALTGFVGAATTISTDITTAGNVYATSTVQADGALIGRSTLAITGTSAFTGLATFAGGAYASTTLQGAAITDYGALTVTGASTHTGDATFGHASTTQLTSSGVAWFGDNVTMNGTAPTLSIAGSVSTSTISVGCIQTYATSTATPVKLIMGPKNTTASSTVTATAIVGYVVWAYGSCPSI